MLKHANKPMTDKKLDLYFEFFLTVNTLQNQTKFGPDDIDMM